MSRLYISATHQHDGKTTVSLGLYALFRKLGKRVHFIKPVGQRYVEIEGLKADEDAILFKHVFHEDLDLSAMSPIAVPSGFTEHYIFHRDRHAIYGEIDRAISQVDHDVDITIVEGTGHAGVGSVFDASNAAVARHIGARALIVSGGGIGRCIDEITLNRALFEQSGVPVIGAIINKVLPAKYAKVDRALRQGLTNLGLSCLGVVPYVPELTIPTVRQIADELGLNILCGEEQLDSRAQSVIVAAMEPQNTITFLRKGTFVITPGDRVDNMLVCVATHMAARSAEDASVSGILLSGGFVPHYTIMNLLQQARIPVLSTQEDTYTVSSAINRFVVKIGLADTEKVRLACELIARHVDGERLLELLGGPSAETEDMP